jgi:hypothetical protein
MPWDDDLEQLTLSVLYVFGDDTLWAAIRRATITALHQADPLDVSSPGGASAVTDSDASLSAGYEALRLELRRLLRPH